LFDVFVLASVSGEAAVLAVLEAMAEGKPVVATAIGGLPEVVVDGVTGRLVPPASPEAMASAIGDLLDRPEERDRMGLAAKERVAKHFSLRAEIEALESLYDELLSGRGRHACSADVGAAFR